MKKFWELFQASVITQSVITVGVVGVWLYMTAAQLPIPTSLQEVVGLVVGFFFGTKYSNAIAQPVMQAYKDLLNKSNANKVQ